MSDATSEKLFAGGRSSRWGLWVARHIYKHALGPSVRKALRAFVMRREGGPVYSRSVREILQRYHGITVGMYSIGPCESDPSHFAPGTVVGRYCSVYYTVRVLAANGPEEGVTEGGPAWSPDKEERGAGRAMRASVAIGHDVYIGHNAIILPGVHVIGDGAVVGAGAVVREDVPPYAVVTGNPARVVRYRFGPATVQELLAGQWWWKTIEELTASGQRIDLPLDQGGRAPRGVR